VIMNLTKLAMLDEIGKIRPDLYVLLTRAALAEAGGATTIKTRRNKKQAVILLMTFAAVSFPAFGGFLRGIGLGLPRRRSRLGWLGAQLLHHRCQAVGAASMRALQPTADLHDPVVSSRWVTRRKIRLIESIDACVGSPRASRASC